MRTIKSYIKSKKNKKFKVNFNHVVTDLNAFYSLDIEQGIERELVNELINLIDRQIINDLYNLNENN